MGLGVSISPSFSLYSRFVSLFSHRASPYAKVCGSLLPQDFSLCQVLWVSSFTGFYPQCQVSWVSSSTGLYLPMLIFVGFFFHRILSPNAKFRGFLFPQDFISQCQVSWFSSSTGLYLPMLSFVGFFLHRTLSPNAKFRGLLPQDFISQC